MSSWFEIILILVLILGNGLLAMSEIAIVSARKSRLQQRAEEGDEGARKALDLAREPSDFLSTVQVGITLVGVLAGAFGGATISIRLAEFFDNIPQLRPYSDALALILVVAVITYLSLVLGELAPKRLALNNAEDIAGRVAGPLGRLARLTGPLVRFLSASTNAVLRLVGSKPSEEPPVTEYEVRVLLDAGTRAGVFEETEQDMVEGVFRLADRSVGSLMTPRTEILWLDVEDPEEEIRSQVIDSVYSRLPVAVGDLDHVLGVVQAKDLLSRALAGEPLDIRAAMIPAQFVPESTPAFQVLDTFRQSGVHIALVIDEFGGLQGLVTIIDILESIVGEMPVSGEGGDLKAVRREDGSWLLDGMLLVDELVDLLGLNHLPAEEKGHYQTVGGFVMAKLGRIPTSGDHFEWGGLRFEVMDMDGFRVDKVMVGIEEEKANE